MKYKLIGIEGGVDDLSSTPVHCGACAITDGDKLINPVTNHNSNISEFNKIVTDGGIQPLKEPIEIDKLYKFAISLNLEQPLLDEFELYLDYPELRYGKKEKNIYMFETLEDLDYFVFIFTDNMFTEIGGNFRELSYKHLNTALIIAKTLNAGFKNAY